MKKTLIIALLALVAVAGKAKEKIVVWEQPSTEVNTLIEGYFRPLLEITRVEFDEDETRVMIHIASRPENWVRISSQSYLRAEGKKYALRSLDGLEADKETYLTDHGYVDAVFHFEPLPKDTKRFDFTEGDVKGAWELLGVEQASTRAGQLFPSNWRNTQTGDWEISFYDECAIYDCQFWNYKQKQQNGDKYTIVLENGSKEITVNVDKNKDGVRAITIDGKKGEYNLISSIAMPDYPQKDTRADFKDTNYRTDTVTFIGWLKDMPENMKKSGKEYEVTVYDNIFDDHHNGNTSFGKMDDLGRFVMKVPMLNTAEVIFDWNRTYIRTLFEPGETYLMLYDFKGGHKLFMGKNCRLQNETLAHRVGWAEVYSEGRMDEEAAMKFLEEAKNKKDKEMQELEKVIKEHPTVSDRYINYLTGVYKTCEGKSLMGGRYENLNIPAEILNYVSQQNWQQPIRPYSLCREFNSFRSCYIRYFVVDRYAMKSGSGYSLHTDDMCAPILRKYRDAGKLSITDEDLDIVDRYHKSTRNFMIISAEDKEAIRKRDEIRKSDLAKREHEIIMRDDVQKVIKEDYPLIPTYFALNVLDSLGCDQDLRDIVITSELQKMIDQGREALSDHIMQFFNENVMMLAAKAYVRAQNEKYLALQRKDISSSLKSAKDVANMSDGEQILRKIIEPYKGKIILLDIWGTWCAPCKEGLKHSQEEYKRLKDYDIVYLYLANNSPDKTWKAIIKEYEVLGDNVVHYNLPQDQQQAIEHFIGVKAFPTYKLIDREGNVLDVNADPRYDLEGLARMLQKLKVEN
ncbi:MAG: TlpA family protein disulfide reductase [Bacteroidaceae bacterium]|nr:TlpA family protein disulfide reductase [Bacteroidaceae bacterium]